MKTLTILFDNQHVFQLIKYALAGCLLVLSCHSITRGCFANETAEDAILMQAEALVRSATLMKEEIKFGFRGTRVWGRLHRFFRRFEVERPPSLDACNENLTTRA